MRGTDVDLKIGKLGQVAFSVSDVDRAVDFYQDKLGLTLLMRPHESMAFFEVGGVRLYLQKAATPEEVERWSTLYFDCADIAAAAEALKAKGVELFAAPRRVTEQPAYDLWMLFVKDPDGHLVGIEAKAPKGYALPD